MRIRNFAVFILAAAALAACGKTDGGSSSNTKAPTTAPATEADTASGEDETTEPVNTSETTEASVESTESASAPVSAAEKDEQEYRQLFKDYDSEKWVPMVYRILKDKPYETVMREEKVYLTAIDLDSPSYPEIVVFNEDATCYTMYSFDNRTGDKYYLSGYGRTYDGAQYMYNPAGFAFACVHENPRAASDKVELRYYTNGDTSGLLPHEHNFAIAHDYLCLDDCKVVEFDALDGRQNAEKWAEYGITVDMDEIKMPEFADSWTKLSPDAEGVYLADADKADEIARKLYDFRLKK